MSFRAFIRRLLDGAEPAAGRGLSTIHRQDSLPAAIDADLGALTDRALRTWQQGDVLRSEHWFGHFGRDGSNGDPERVLVLTEVPGLVVITQTCDIVRSCAERPFLEFSPLVALDDERARQARKGQRPQYAHVPALGLEWFADLDRVMTVEKVVAAEWSRTPGVRGDDQIRRLGEAIARRYARFAFPDDLKPALKGLVDRITDKHGRASDEGRALEALEEIRVVGSPSWTDDEIEVFLMFVPPTRRAGDIADDDWSSLIDKWIKKCKPHGVIRKIEGALIPLDEMTARDYRSSDPLDLDHLSG